MQCIKLVTLEQKRVFYKVLSDVKVQSITGNQISVAPSLEFSCSLKQIMWLNMFQ